jgi:SAM-dependent methyltransferase
MDDLPQRFVIRESSHRSHNPFTSEKLATLGRALYLSPGTSVLDLACGSGEMLCTWARDHRLTGTGVDISTAFIGAARARAIELDVADRVTFIHGDAAGYVAERPVGVASCIGATWIGTAWPGRLSCCGAASAREASCWSANRTGVASLPIRPPSKVATGPGRRTGSRCRS